MDYRSKEDVAGRRYLVLRPRRNHWPNELGRPRLCYWTWHRCYQASSGTKVPAIRPCDHRFQIARVFFGIHRVNLPESKLRRYNEVASAKYPMAEQQAIADALRCLDDQLQQAGAEREAFRVSKLALADALLSGRIRTSNVDAVESGLKSGTEEARIATGQKA